MRSGLGRVLTAGLLTGAALAAMSGCAKVDLANEWPAMAEPTGWEPQAGVCTDVMAVSTTRASYKPEDCAGVHYYETIHIGQFTAEAAALPEPPVQGTAHWQAAWTECDGKTTEFLGGLWRAGRIEIAVSVPHQGNWEGGARWFRCLVYAMDAKLRTTESSSQSLKGAFAGDSRLKFGCIKRGDEPILDLPCSEPHDVEFVGVFNTTESFDEANKNLNSIHQRCRSLVAAYVGVPDDGNLKYRTGTWYWIQDQKRWDAGDRGVRCHMLLPKNVTKSLKGAGTKGLPINYA